MLCGLCRRAGRARNIWLLLLLFALLNIVVIGVFRLLDHNGHHVPGVLNGWTGFAGNTLSSLTSRKHGVATGKTSILLLPGGLENRTSFANRSTSDQEVFDIAEPACVPYELSPEAKKFVKRHFAPRRGIEKCKNQVEPPYELCTFRERKSKERFTKLTFKCNLSVCNRKKNVTIELLNPVTGGVKKVTVPPELANGGVEQMVQKHAEKTRSDGFPFLFLNCTGLKGKKIAQFLPFLPALEPYDELLGADKVNINMILLDSISRPHFYRSLPKTVEFIKKVQTDNAFDAHVFEYELFQAVNRYTHENERALFDGILFAGHIPVKERDSSPLHYDVFFSVFKRFGYQTMFLDDLCWRGIYGLMTKYKVRSWPALRKYLAKSTIDSLGFTDASCNILHNVKGSSRHTAFFNTDNHQVCFNAKHHHKYQFEYIERYLNTTAQTPQSKPLFIYTSSHVNHDMGGVRVQSLDSDLRDFIATMATKENTLTILFADHGNTYTRYQYVLQDGRQETYHPSMVVVLPKKLAQRLGRDVVRNLRTNQRRLFTLFDVRDGLTELATYDGKTAMHPKGIFAPIPKERTCDDITISMSALCICQHWDKMVPPSARYTALAEFAIGEMNNEIQQTLGTKVKEGQRRGLLFGACQRLRVTSVAAVRTRISKSGSHLATLDVLVQPDPVANTTQMFSVQVASDEGGRTDTPAYFVSYTRINSFHAYYACRDRNANIKTCLCNKGRYHTTLEDVVGKNAEVTKLEPSCLVAIRRSHEDNVTVSNTYEVANLCTYGKRSFEVLFDKTEEGKKTWFSRKLPAKTLLAPRTIYFVATTMTAKKDPVTKIKWSVLPTAA